MEKPTEKPTEKTTVKPVIKTIGKQLCTYCPFCGDLIYEREPGKNAELSCEIAFARHASNCRSNPDYKETEMDKLKKKIMGDTD
jgi:hypothetical protein